MTTRRGLLVGIATVLAAPRTVGGQERPRTYRIGVLSPTQRDASVLNGFFDELRQAGLTIEIDPRGWGGRADQYPAAARGFADAKVDLVLCGGDAAIRAAQAATTSIPILALTDDILGSGLVRSLANPGGNTTGVSILAAQLDGKRQDLLIEMLPGLRRMAALVDTGTTALRQLQALQETARARGVELSLHRVTKPEEIGPAIDSAKQAGAAALNVLASPLFFAQTRAIMARVAALRIPTMYQWPESAEEGGLVGYGPSIVRIFRELVARQAVKLLRGVKPADIPIEQPTQFELVVNLRTGRALGLTLPSSFLARADKVI